MVKVVFDTNMFLSGFIEPTIKIGICRDPEDNFLLELSETVLVDYLITRDKDLLDLSNQEWKDTKIIKPEDLLPLLRKMGLLDDKTSNSN